MEMPTLPWLNALPLPPVRPMVSFCHVPEMAIWTGPGFGAPFQQAIEVVAEVEGIVGSAHQLATRSGRPFNWEDTNCHGGACRADGLEMKVTPEVDRGLFIKVVLVDSTPNFWANATRLAGPPALKIWGLPTLVTMLALTRPARTMATSAGLSFNAKKCWLTMTSS